MARFYWCCGSASESPGTTMHDPRFESSQLTGSSTNACKALLNLPISALLCWSWEWTACKSCVFMHNVDCHTICSCSTIFWFLAAALVNNEHGAHIRRIWDEISHVYIPWALCMVRNISLPCFQTWRWANWCSLAWASHLATSGHCSLRCRRLGVTLHVHLVDCAAWSSSRKCHHGLDV